MLPSVITPQLSSRRQLKAVLDRLYSDFNHIDSAADPVHIVRRYTNPPTERWWGSVRPHSPLDGLPVS